MWFFCLEKGNLFKHESKKVKNYIDFYVKQGSWKSILKQDKKTGASEEEREGDQHLILHVQQRLVKGWEHVDYE